jgi:hypothetical protein
LATCRNNSSLCGRPCSPGIDPAREGARC